MAHVVLGLGTSHTPMLSLESRWWRDHARLDPALVDDFDDRVQRAPEWLAAEVADEALETKFLACQRAIDTLSEALRDADPDVVFVIGDDQHEMFLDDAMPMFATFCGDSLLDLPADTATLPATVRKASWAMHGEREETYPSSRAIAEHVTQRLAHDDIDVCCVRQQVPGRTLGHAYTFVRRRLMQGEEVRPIVPIFLNTYYPPNTPSASRCVHLGRSIAEAIESFEEPLRVAIVASGGLSHFVVDQDLDQEVIRCLEQGDMDGLGDLARDQLVMGSSEILNWIAAGSVLHHSGLKMELVDYVAAYRSLAETGVGCCFAIWR